MASAVLIVSGKKVEKTLGEEQQTHKLDFLRGADDEHERAEMHEEGGEQELQQLGQVGRVGQRGEMKVIALHSNPRHTHTHTRDAC